jgi:hypothetical protein
MNSVEFGGQTWTLFPLNARELKELARLGKRFEAIRHRVFSPEHIDFLVDIVFTGLTRNYPDLTKEQLGEWLNAKNIWEIAEAVTEAGGFTRPRRLDS